jgi:pheromone shutdown protein TraB
MKRRASSVLLFRDAALIALSVVLAVVLVRTRALEGVVAVSRGSEALGAFVAGLFFTSAFTTAPAIVALGEVAKAQSPFVTAAIGALGASVSDALLFGFVKNHLVARMLDLLKLRKRKRLRQLLEGRAFRWLTFFAGGLVIASPLPDELGISLLGLSRVRIRWFVVVSYAFNFLGILLIALAARQMVR